MVIDGCLSQVHGFDFDLVMDILRVGYGVNLILSYPVMLFELRHVIEAIRVRVRLFELRHVIEAGPNSAAPRRMGPWPHAAPLLAEIHGGRRC